MQLHRVYDRYWLSVGAHPSALTSLRARVIPPQRGNLACIVLIHSRMQPALSLTRFEAEGLASNPARIALYRSLLHSVLREMQQTERFALLHCGKEATRLGRHGPVAPLRAIVAHATEFEPQLAALFIEQRVPWPRVGDIAGRAMSFVRSAAFDKLAGHERSYRATLLGVRHGLDVARMLHQVAVNATNLPVADFASQWLAGREPLIAPLADGLRWFASHPGVARATVWARHALPK